MSMEDRPKTLAHTHVLLQPAHYKGSVLRTGTKVSKGNFDKASWAFLINSGIARRLKEVV